MNIQEYPDRELMMMAVANRVAGELNSALMTSDRATLAVPGGSTPGPAFDALASADIDWSKVSVMLTDERWVPEDNSRSNTGLVRKRLITDRAAAARLVPLYADAETPEDALDGLQDEVSKALPLNVLLLGMGSDGHIASLFPGADRLEDALSDRAPPLMAMRAPGAPEPRVTLTAPVLRGALATHILITGQEKRETLEKARHAKAREMPVRVVWADATVHWAE